MFTEEECEDCICRNDVPSNSKPFTGPSMVKTSKIGKNLRKKNTHTIVNGLSMCVFGLSNKVIKHLLSHVLLTAETHLIVYGFIVGVWLEFLEDGKLQMYFSEMN